MNVLILGLGAESQIIRGDQLGGAIGARVRRKPQAEDLAWADVVVLLKRAGPQWAREVHAAGKPLIWDALDFWHQPDENDFDRTMSILLLKERQRDIEPTVTICATEAMASVCGGVYLPHHTRPDLVPQPIRDVVRVVAYEGIPKYLGRWRNVVARECERRGWHFLVNPPHLAYADIVVAFRDGQWDGWMCQNWKSGVKIVNAIGAGRPIITQPSAAFDEIQPVGTTVENFDELSSAFDLWLTKEMRATAKTGHEFSLSWIARRYQEILESVVVRC